MRKFLQGFYAGAFVQESGKGVSSLAGLNVASGVTFTGVVSLAGLAISSLTGGAGWRGIATINSGTTVATVAATAAVSGAVIQATIYQYVNAQSSLSPSNVAVQSVAAGQFLVQTVGSIAPTAPLYVAWSIIR